MRQCILAGVLLNIYNCCAVTFYSVKMLTIESIFRRLLNAGIGIASKTTKFAEDVINELVDKGKLTEEEGKDLIDNFVREGEQQRHEFENEMNAYIEKALSTMDLPTREEYRQLDTRLSVLEKSQPG